MDSINNKKIVLVIVTYNRLALLKECLNSIYQQTYQNFDIVVVNNGSTDKTKEFLSKQKNIIVINQENVGGAGGFYSGMKYMYNHNYEWLWMMDDDGIADSKQLQNLLQAGEKYKFLNALVVNKDNHKEFAFTAPKITKIAEAIQYPIIKEFIHPFNGTLIHRSVIDKIGLIKKEMFIWGDEQEYTARAIKAGFIPVTVTNAVHYHPKEKGVKANALPFIKSSRFTILIKPQNLSHIYYRNQGYIYKNFGKHWYSGLQLLILYTIYYLRTFNILELKKLYTYCIKGMKNEY